MWKDREQLHVSTTPWLEIKQKHSNIERQHAQYGATDHSMLVPCCAELSAEAHSSHGGHKNILQEQDATCITHDTVALAQTQAQHA